VIGKGAGGTTVGVIGDGLDMTLDRAVAQPLGGRGNNRDVAVLRPSMRS